ncbi:MAG: hypothetical protein IKF71_05360 [Bacilli bacterium]|nr:hypothetical protein [Bacilli bacterium]
MSSRKKLLYIFGFIILDAFLLVGFLVIRDATSINKLKKEINELTKLDVTSDRFNRSIQTSGKYAVVEESIKDYLDGYAIEVQDLGTLIHDPKLTKVLSYENYEKDGPEFNESIAYLEESRELFNDKIDGLLYDLEEEQIMNHIHERIDDSYYVGLYQDLMFDDSMKGELDQSKELFQRTRTKMNNIYDSSLEVLNFLKTYQGSWELDNGTIKFQNDELLEYYNSLVSKVEVRKDE